MLKEVVFDDGGQRRYLRYDSNTKCVYVGFQDAHVGNQFVAFSSDEWRAITQAFYGICPDDAM